MYVAAAKGIINESGEWVGPHTPKKTAESRATCGSTLEDSSSSSADIASISRVNRAVSGCSDIYGHERASPGGGPNLFSLIHS